MLTRTSVSARSTAPFILADRLGQTHERESLEASLIFLALCRKAKRAVIQAIPETKAVGRDFTKYGMLRLPTTKRQYKSGSTRLTLALLLYARDDC